MAPTVYPIQPAELLQCERCPGSHGYAVSKLRFKVPLQHNCADITDDFIELNASMVYAETRLGGDQRATVDWTTCIREDGALRDLPIVLYLCGGPGAE